MRSLARSVVVMFAFIGVIATVQQLRGQAAAPLQGANFTHIGIVTKDITKTAQMFADVKDPLGFTIEVGRAPQQPSGAAALPVPGR